MIERIRDITAVPIQDMLDISGIERPEKLKKLKQHTPAHIGIGYTGARYKTVHVLRFLGNQAAAHIVELILEILKKKKSGVSLGEE